MSVWEGPYREMDPLTFNAVVRLQLEDSEELVSTSKGKQREGTITDAQLALQLYTEDLMQCDATLRDRSMAQSMAHAVIRDGELINRVSHAELQFARDRELAHRLNRDEDSRMEYEQPDPRGSSKVDIDAWQDNELLSKAAAIYMFGPDQPSAPSLVNDSGSDDCQTAESSAWAAGRSTTEKPKMGHCVACGDEKVFFDVARVPCEHEYCRECLAALFRMSITDETLFPPRCCREAIPISRIRFFLPQDLAREFEEKAVELGTKNRTYCHDDSCSTFIPTTAIREDLGVCPNRRKTTCMICKAPSHSGDCPEDTALNQLVGVAETEQWQRCLDCHRFVELETGCNHITCRCGAEFCYACGTLWKGCACPQWHEDRLIARAAQLVDRNAGRRLFQPPRVAHEQPTRPQRSRRPTATATLSGPAALARASSAPLAAQIDVHSPTSSTWQSDFSDQSEWEEDWSDSDPVEQTTAACEALEDASTPPPPRLLSPVPPAMPASPGSSVSPVQADSDDLSRTLRIAEAIQHLRDNHECDHHKWLWVRGRHQCEECHDILYGYIFECKQCQIQACNRCRRNRL